MGRSVTCLLADRPNPRCLQPDTDRCVLLPPTFAAHPSPEATRHAHMVVHCLVHRMLKFVKKMPSLVWDPVEDYICWIQRRVLPGTSVINETSHKARPGHFITHKTMGKVKLFGVVGDALVPISGKRFFRRTFTAI